jgi:hypothetical protein
MSGVVIRKAVLFFQCEAENPRYDTLVNDSSGRVSTIESASKMELVE